MSNLVISVHETEGFSKEQLAYYKVAVEKTQKVVNSKRFYEKLLKLKLTNNRGMTNKAIYEKMMGGAEDLEPVQDNEADVFISMYYKNNRVVGYTLPSTRKTWVNSKFFDQYEHADIGCNLIHEWLHKLGFDHSSASEVTSVPYAVGYLVEDCIREMEKNPGLYEDEKVPAPVPTPKPVEPKPEPTPAPVPEKKQVCKRLWYTLWTKKVCWYE